MTTQIVGATGVTSASVNPDSPVDPSYGDWQGWGQGELGQTVGGYYTRDWAWNDKQIYPFITGSNPVSNPFVNIVRTFCCPVRPERVHDVPG